MCGQIASTEMDVKWTRSEASDINNASAPPRVSALSHANQLLGVVFFARV